jgi:hypothetical protein
MLFFITQRLLPAAINQLEARLYQDDRSQQYVDFFSDVQWQELALGRGPAGTWYWPGIGNFQFIDNGYLWMAFIGGLPILLAYCVLILLPAVHALWAGAPLNISSAAWIILLWALALGGLSNYNIPSLTLQSYCISLFAGRCHAWLSESRGSVHSTVPIVSLFMVRQHNKALR